MVECSCKSRIPTLTFSTFHLFFYSNSRNPQEYHLVFAKGNFESTSLNQKREGESLQDRLIRGATDYKQPKQEGVNTCNTILVRIHSSCITSETFGSIRCDCFEQLQESMRLIAQQEYGLIIYLHQEGRGIGLLDKLKAYNLIDMGHDTLSANIALGHEPDPREYTIAASILKDLQVNRICLLTNNPNKIQCMKENGIHVETRVESLPKSWISSPSSNVSSEFADQDSTFTERDAYLFTKSQKMGHLISLPPHIVELINKVL